MVGQIQARENNSCQTDILVNILFFEIIKKPKGIQLYSLQKKNKLLLILAWTVIFVYFSASGLTISL